jgi:MoaA/NifB/PqqE/SkfB family radical SAM enzyme
MSVLQSLNHSLQRYRTLQTHTIHALPIVILMPHSACNCRCVMCDIWKDNKNLKQLTETDIAALLPALKKLGTQMVLMSGGEALLNQNFFSLCRMLTAQGIKISLHSTGLTLAKHAENIVKHVHDVIISLDGPEELHNRIRNIPDAYAKMKAGIQAIRRLEPDFSISGRSVIHRLNFRSWSEMIDSARDLGLDKISFLPADVSSHAFNREVLWSEQRQDEILPAESELPELQNGVEELISKHAQAISEGFIAEPAEKLRKIYSYYAAIYGQEPFPYKKCNAPWVSTVIEADGTVRPCFFHESIGNVKEANLEQILNGDKGMHFRKSLDIDSNSTCVKCVCYLNLNPRTSLS